MSIKTTYLGLTLRSPLVMSASPLATELDNIVKMEDAGAAAVVLNSLYEEEIRKERAALFHHLEYGTESFAESLTYFPERDVVYARTDSYLEHLRRAKARVDIPIIASLNGSTLGGWTDFALKMQQAGADALELNVYSIPTDETQTSEDVENEILEIVSTVKASVEIPVAVKLSPYFTNLMRMAHQLDETGADGLVLFNRFYQPDIDLETLEPEPNILLSTSYDLRLPLRWIAILYGRVTCDLAATSGIHMAEDVIKVLMTGAKVAMMTSAILKYGIDHFRLVEKDMLNWLTLNEYESVEQLRGSMSHANVENPGAFERAQYMRGLKTYHPNSDV